MRYLVLMFALLWGQRFAQAEEARYTLDFRSTAGECRKPERLADEVSAKLGFVKWSKGGAKLRVRITQDGGELVATAELGENNYKLLRKPDCASLMSALATSISVLLDPPEVLGVLAGGDNVLESVLGKPESIRAAPKQTAPKKQTGTVHVRSTKPGVKISMVIDEAAYTGGYGFSYKDLCYAPCTFELRTGLQKVVASGVGPQVMQEIQVHPQNDVFLVAEPGSNPKVVGAVLLTTLGITAAYLGGRFEALVMRIVDLQLSFPAILLALVLVALLGQGKAQLVTALVAAQYAYFARTAYGAATAERRKDYIEAARATPLSDQCGRLSSPAAKARFRPSIRLGEPFEGRPASASSWSP